MLVIPDHAIILATPRTGSRALESAFEGLKPYREHHVHPEDIEERCEKLSKGSSKLPKFTVCRNPYLQVLSWYYHADAKHDPEKPTITGLLRFIKERNISWYFSSRLNPYHGEVKDLKILRYDRDALANALVISRLTGAEIKNPPRLIGQSVGFDDSLLNNREVLKAIEERFPEDIKLYDHISR